MGWGGIGLRWVLVDCSGWVQYVAVCCDTFGRSVPSRCAHFLRSFPLHPWLYSKQRRLSSIIPTKGVIILIIRHTYTRLLPCVQPWALRSRGGRVALSRCLCLASSLPFLQGFDLRALSKTGSNSLPFIRAPSGLPWSSGLTSAGLRFDLPGRLSFRGAPFL